MTNDDSLADRIRRANQPTPRLSADEHFIAPVCGTCGREIDKHGEQWSHVSDRPIEGEWRYV